MKRLISPIIILLTGVLIPGCRSASGEAEEKAHASEHVHEESDELELSATQIKTVDIEFGKVSSLTMGSSIKVTGELVVDSKDMGTVTSILPGIVKKLNIRTGERVFRGSVVAYVETPELISIQQDYLQAKEEEKLAQEELQRQQALASEGAGVKKNLQRASTDARIASSKVTALGKQLALYGVSPSSVGKGKFVSEIAVKSPLDGIVTDVTVTPGQFTDAQFPLMKIVNNTGVYCRLTVFEKDIDKIHSGQQVTLRLTNRPDVQLKGEVVSFLPVIDSSSKAMDVRVKLTEGFSESIVPGMAVTGMIISDEEEVEALPEEAIVSAEGKYYVYAVEGSEEEDGEMMTHFRRVEIIPGVREGGFVQVKFLNAMSPDTLFVTKNAFFLGSMSSDHGEHNH